MEKKLYRNEHDKAIAGVASGLADYLDIDLTIVRVLFVLSAVFLGGAGIIIYIVLWIVAPVNNDPKAKYKKFTDYFQQSTQGGSIFNSANAFSTPDFKAEQTKWNTPTNDTFKPFGEEFKPASNNTGKTIVGLILLILGIYFLLRELGFLPFWFSIHHLYKLWPLAIVAVGASLIFKNKRKNEWEEFKKTNDEAQYEKEHTSEAEVKQDNTDTTQL